MARIETVSFTLKDEGDEFTGNLGELRTERKQRTQGGGKRTIRSRSLVVEKRVMTKTPVIGRTVTIVSPALVYEIETYAQDDISWTLTLVEPKQGS